MAPVCVLMGFLVALPQLMWVRLSAALVIGLSLYGLLRGYVRRAALDESGVSFKSLGASLRMPWNEVRRVDTYIPSGGVNGARYVFITRHDRPPRSRDEIDADTFQLQDRPGLLDALRHAWHVAAPTTRNTPPNPRRNA
jgi:hypothetical protein